jgi:hypothetical protein
MSAGGVGNLLLKPVYSARRWKKAWQSSRISDDTSIGVFGSSNMILLVHGGIMRRFTRRMNK